MTLPKEFRQGILSKLAGAASEVYQDAKEFLTTDISSFGHLAYGVVNTLSEHIDSEYSGRFDQVEPEDHMAGVLTESERQDWIDRQNREWKDYADQLKREVPMEALARELDTASIWQTPSVIIDPIIYQPEEYEDITHLFSDLVVEEIKGYTEEELVAAIELDDKKTAISNLVAGFEDADASYSIKALGIAGSFDATDIGSAENAFLELSDLNGDYQAEKQVAMAAYRLEKECARLKKNASMISYKDVLERADQLQAIVDSDLVCGKTLDLQFKCGDVMESVYSNIDEAMVSADGQEILAEQVTVLDDLKEKLDVLGRADQLQAVIDSGLVGNSLRVRVNYGRKMRSVYSGIDAAMGSTDGQTILAEQVANLDALEVKLNCVAAAKVESVACKASSAYGKAVIVDGVDISDSVKQELYSGASGLTTFAVDIKYNGLGDVDLGMYANSISSLEATADKIAALCDNSAKASTYSPPPIKVAQPQL